MARKTSRRISRKSRLRSNRRRGRGLLRNLYGADFQHDVLMPVLSGTAGFVGGRYLGNAIAMKDWGTTDPRRGKLYAALVGISLVYFARQKMKSQFLDRHANMLALGIGLAATEAYLRNTKMLGGSPAASVLAPASTPPEGTPPDTTTAASGVGVYYTQDMLNGMGDMEPVSTVIPTDEALPATDFPQWKNVSEKFTNQGDRGYAGGIFARQLFSGMMGG